MADLYGRINIRIYKDSRGVEVAWDNDQSKLISLIGSLEISKQLMIETARNTQQRKKEKKSEVMLGKDEAMKVYFELGQKIKERLIAMQKSNDNAQFDINPDLLSLV